MSYENEIKHLMRELKFAKSDYLNARLKSEDALRIHSFKTDVETIEFQIEVFKKAAKVDECEAKAKAFDKIVEQRKKTDVTTLGHHTWKIIKEYQSGELNAKK